MYTFLFDFDGVLVDSMTMWSNAVIRLLNEHNVEYPNNLIEIITPLGNGKTADYLISIGLNMKNDEILKYIEDIAIKEYTYNIPAKSGVLKTVGALRQKGYSLNVLTASPHPIVDICLKRLELYGFFDNVWSCDDFKMTKTNPEIYKSAAKKLGYKCGNCVVFDDNLVAVTTAKKAGLKVVGVYDETSKQYESEMRSVCDLYVHSIDEAGEFLGIF